MVRAAPLARVALVALSVAVALAAAGAVLQGVREVRGATSLPSDPVPAAAATAPVTSPSAGVLRTAGETTQLDADPATFTLRELHDGEVSIARFTAFWDAELERIRQAPCPGPTASGTTVVVVAVGATPPQHLADDYPDYAPRIAAARTEAATGCA